jgi:hypothetical protein
MSECKGETGGLVGENETDGNWSPLVGAVRADVLFF